MLLDHTYLSVRFHICLLPVRDITCPYRITLRFNSDRIGFGDGQVLIGCLDLVEHVRYSLGRDAEKRQVSDGDEDSGDVRMKRG